MNRNKKHRLLYVLTIVAILSACTNKSDIRYVSPEHTATPLPLILPAASPEADAPDADESSYVAITHDNSLFISEISASGEDWVEFYNSSSSPISLSAYCLGTSDDFSKAVQLPDVNVEPGAYCCIYGKKEENPLRAGFSVNKAGDTLVLFHGDGTVSSSVTVPALSSAVSWALSQEEWGYTYFKTPGQPNSSYIFATLEPEDYSENCPLVINEVLASNKHSVLDSYAEYNDFVEVYNPADHPISLHGWFLSDDFEKPAKWAFPDTNISAGQYIAVYLSGHESTASELHASFCLRSGENIILFNAFENKYIQFDMPSALINDISVGPGNSYYRFPTPGFENAAPISDLTRIGCFYQDDVFISEVCSFGDENDWAEIHNGSSNPVNLSGWHLTDDLAEPDRYTFPQVVIDSGDYYVVEASSHSYKRQDQIAKFGISLTGETLYLIDDAGRVHDVFQSGMMDKAASSGRIEDDPDIDRVFFAVSTPGKKNSSSYFTGRTSEPIFSTTSLYCSEKFSLTLTAEDDAEIYFTTDGSTPKASQKQLYSGPISISENTVVRAVAVKNGQLDSNVVTYTYLFEEPHSIPVVCISLSPSDKDAVWSAKSKKSNTKVEREGYLSYYESDGRMGVSFPAGFKPKGAGTLGRAQASLSIHLRGMYGQSRVTYPFFQEYGWETYASLVVRNSGQDYVKARIRDSLASRICLGLNIDVAATRPVAVYVNGKYYGLYDLNEDQNADFLHTHYGVDQKSVEIIRFNTVEVKGSNSNWKKVIEFAKTKNFKSDANYEQLLEWIDEDFFIDYLVCSIYMCNSDMANQKYWHTIDNEIKWRPILYDFDYAMGFNRSAKSSIMERFFDPAGTETATSTIYTHIACALVQNAQWRQKFVERFIELTYTTFDPERVNGIVDQLVSEMESEMPRHIARWGSRNAPASVHEWHENVDNIKSWFSQRQKYAIESLKKYFKLSDSEIEKIKARYI